jgi:hypothetical protein
MADILDTDPQSNDFFFITDFDYVFGLGKNSFVVNPTDRILPNATASINVYSADGVQLFTQSARAKDAKYGDSTPNGATYYTKVDTDAYSGVGYIEIVSTAADLGNYDGKIAYYRNIPYKVSATAKLPLISAPTTGELPVGTITWKRKILIDTTVSTTSTVRFFEYPKFSVTPKIYSVPEYPSQPYAVASGSFYSTAVIPKHNENGDYNIESSNIVYQIYRNSGTEFTSAMSGESIRLKAISVSKFVYSDFGGYELVHVGELNTDFITKIKKIVSKNSLLLDIPFVTVSELIGTTNQDSEYSKNNLANIYGYFVSNDPTKQNSYHKKNFYCLSLNSGQYEIVYENISASLPRKNPQVYKPVLNLEFINLRALCGKINYYKIYGRSLSYPQSKVLMSEGKIESHELVRGSGFDNGLTEDAGKFYSSQHLAKYWITSAGSLYFSQSSDVLIDGAIISHSYNSSKTDYVIFKDNTIESSRSATYVYPTIVSESYWYATNGAFNNKLAYPSSSFTTPTVLAPYTISQENLINGSAHNSNPMKLNGNALYQFSMNVKAAVNNTNLSEMYVYFLSGTEKIEIGYIGEDYNLGADRNYTSQFFVSNTKFGTIILVPVSGGWNISDVSIKPYDSLAYSVDTFSVSIPVKNTVQNELFEIEAELYDGGERLAYGADSYNFIYNKSYLPLSQRVFVDIDGITL